MGTVTLCGHLITLHPFFSPQAATILQRTSSLSESIQRRKGDTQESFQSCSLLFYNMKMQKNPPSSSDKTTATPASVLISQVAATPCLQSLLVPPSSHSSSSGAFKGQHAAVASCVCVTANRKLIGYVILRPAGSALDCSLARQISKNLGDPAALHGVFIPYIFAKSDKFAQSWLQPSCSWSSGDVCCHWPAGLEPHILGFKEKPWQKHDTLLVLDFSQAIWI